MKSINISQILEDCREAGWLVTIKVMPKQCSYIIEGSRSEYDAPCDDQEFAKGKVMVEGMNMKDRTDWNRHAVFANTIELAVCLFAGKILGDRK